MFSKMRIRPFMKNLCKGNKEEQISRLKTEIKEADAIVIGAGAGLSTSAGLTYSGERFEKYFFDFAKRFGIRDMYSGGFYPFWQMTLANEKAVYACLNYGEAFCPEEIADRSICIDGDIATILQEF
jgi:hypothetical protein